jgi:hypothetical protein
VDGSEVDPLEDASTLVREAAERGIPLRLVGGVAIRLLCPDFPPRVRRGQDLDLASVASVRPALTRFLTERGYVPDKLFNNLHGRKQLYFTSPDGQRGLDVIIDRLDMCHVLEFRSRLERMPLTLDPTDLLLSKLQIVELNEKDLQDALYLLAAFPVRDGDEPGTIGLGRFCEIVARDWGWWRTVTGNLDRVAALSDEDRARMIPEAPPFDPVDQARRLRDVADTTPKSPRWRLRGLVGERVAWYKLPEEIVRQ